MSTTQCNDTGNNGFFSARPPSSARYVIKHDNIINTQVFNVNTKCKHIFSHFKFTFFYSKSSDVTLDTLDHSMLSKLLPQMKLSYQVISD